MINEPRTYTVVVFERGRLGYVTLTARDMGEAIARVQGRFQPPSHSQRSRFRRVVMDAWAEVS